MSETALPRTDDFVRDAVDRVISNPLDPQALHASARIVRTLWVRMLDDDSMQKLDRDDLIMMMCDEGLATEGADEAGDPVYATTTPAGDRVLDLGAHDLQTTHEAVAAYREAFADFGCSLQFDDRTMAAVVTVTRGPAATESRTYIEHWVHKAVAEQAPACYGRIVIRWAD